VPFSAHIASANVSASSPSHGCVSLPRVGVAADAGTAADAEKLGGSLSAVVRFVAFGSSHAG